MDSFGIAFMTIFWVIYISVFGAIFAAMYIFNGLALYRIAARRGISKPWLAWVPGGDAWILGCISDQYRHVAHGLVTTRRKKLLTWFIVLVAVLFLFCCVTGGLVVAAIAAENAGMDITVAVAVLMVLLFVLYFALIAFLTVYAIQFYKCLFDLYRSCKPSLAVLFLMLSIFVAPSCAFMFAVRNWDEGMPPRQIPQAEA